MDKIQSRYFGSTPYEYRHAWILEEPFVREGEMRILQQLFMRVQHLPVGGRILEVGCGAGTNLALLQMFDATKPCSGIDPCPEAVDAAKRVNLPVSLGDGFALPFEEKTFDLVFCRDVLHHLATSAERRAFLQEMERVTKQGGVVIAIEPNVLHPLIFLQQLTQPAERGVRAIQEQDLLPLFPSSAVVQVVRHEPSLYWRLAYHYRVPAWGKSLLRSPFVRFVLTTWQHLVARTVPSRFWGYRTYSWRR